MTPDPRQHPLRCQCGDCTLPFGYVQNGILVIQTEHYGKKHINVLTLGQVLELLKQQEAAV